VLSSLAHYYARTNDSARARAYLLRALKADAQDVDILLNACLIYLEAGEREEALSWLRKAVSAGYSREQLLANPELHSLHSSLEFDLLAKPKPNSVRNAVHSKQSSSDSAISFRKGIVRPHGNNRARRLLRFDKNADKKNFEDEFT
jgi:tetratricopeptide (TPR) repeat protein